MSCANSRVTKCPPMIVWSHWPSNLGILYLTSSLMHTLSRTLVNKNCIQYTYLLWTVFVLLTVAFLNWANLDNPLNLLPLETVFVKGFSGPFLGDSSNFWLHVGGFGGVWLDFSMTSRFSNRSSLLYRGFLLCWEGEPNCSRSAFNSSSVPGYMK